MEARISNDIINSRSAKAPNRKDATAARQRRCQQKQQECELRLAVLGRKKLIHKGGKSVNFFKN
jgi:hypothetical protein